MSDRLVAISLGLLLAAPLCFVLDGELFESETADARQSSHLNLSAEDLRLHAEGLQDGRTVAAQSLTLN